MSENIDITLHLSSIKIRSYLCVSNQSYQELQLVKCHLK